MLIVSIPKTKHIQIAQEERAAQTNSHAKMAFALTKTICGI
jgi:hypothetical protein